MIPKDNASPCGFRMVIKFHRTSLTGLETTLTHMNSSQFEYMSTSAKILFPNNITFISTGDLDFDISVCERHISTHNSPKHFHHSILSPS